MSYEFHFTQQGWQCPVCGAVYSPMTIQCVNCTGWKVTNNYEGTNGEEKDSPPYSMVRQIQDSESVSDGKRKASMGEGNQRLPHSETETPKVKHTIAPFRDSPNVHVGCGMLPSVFSSYDDEP